MHPGSEFAAQCRSNLLRPYLVGALRAALISLFALDIAVFAALRAHSASVLTP